MTGIIYLTSKGDGLTLIGKECFVRMKGRVAALCFFWAVAAWGQVPDPGDSVIIESKTVAPNLTGSPAFAVKVYITNKDSLTFFTLTLASRTIAGNAYVLLNSPRSFGNVITPLTNTLRYFSAGGGVNYDGVSPDSFIYAAGFDPTDPSTIEPPNSVRKAVWEIKFKHTSDSVGQVILDHLNGSIANQVITFTNTVPKDIKAINFLPGVVTVAPYPKGDLNHDFALAPTDVVLLLRCVMLLAPPPGGVASCDLNCDGQGTIADVMLLLNAVFLMEPFPC